MTNILGVSKVNIYGKHSVSEAFKGIVLPENTILALRVRMHNEG